MRAVTRDELGGWLLRCSPTRTELRTRFSAPIRSWCVADNYRSRLMTPGDLVLLWVSGHDPRFVRGVWAAGTVTAPAEPGEDAWRVGLELVVGGEPLATDRELRAAGIADLEVQRMPEGSNPSWVSAGQLARLRSLDLERAGWPR